MSNHKTNNSRRDFLLKSMTLIPAAVIGGSGVGALTAPTPAVAASNTTTQNDYQPTFFTPEEWAFIKAAVARLIPADERGPGALEAGVPEFIDRQMNTPYATGSIWYMQGPFNPDVPKEMGYQLPLVPKQIYNLGISDADAYRRHAAKVRVRRGGVPAAAVETVLLLSAAKHPRRFLQRSYPWRQQRHGGLEAD